MPVELHNLKVQSITNLGEFIVREHHIVLPLLFERCKTDEEIGTALFYIFDKQDKRDTLINGALKEIAKIPKTDLGLTEYIRGNEITMVIFSKTLQTSGQRYLKKVVQPTLKKIITKYSTYEIAPGKVSSDNAAKNLSNLLKATSKLLNSVYKHISEIPMELKELLYNLYSELNSVHTLSKEKLVGSTFFLRLLCPAITKLKMEDKKIDTDVRRGLILIAKLVQLIANATTELAKDDPMKLTESFIKEQQVKSYGFASTLLDMKSKTTSKVGTRNSGKYYEASVNHIYTWLHKHYEECEKLMMERGISDFQHVMDNLRKVTGSDPTFADDFQQVWKRVQGRINMHELGLVQRGDLSRSTFSTAFDPSDTSSTNESTSEIDSEDLDSSSSSFPRSESFDMKPIMFKMYYEKEKKMQIMKMTMPSFTNVMEWVQSRFDVGEIFRIYVKSKDGQKTFIVDDGSFINILPAEGETAVPTLYIDSI